MKYQIFRADRELGQIQVAYFDDSDNQIAAYCIDLPVENNMFPTGQDLEKIIQDHSPKYIIERQRNVSDATNFSEIEVLVKKLPENKVDAQEIANNLMWQYETFKSEVSKVLVDVGLLKQNPSIIESTKL